MNAVAAIEIYRVALLRLVQEMFSAAGIVPGGDPVATLPKVKRLLIQRVLGPAESAVRRLIQFIADKTSGPLPKERAASGGKTKKKRGDTGAAKTRRKRPPVFGLFDRQKYFPELNLHKPRFVKGRGPQFCFLDEWQPPEPEPEKVPRHPDDASRLCRRLQALLAALNDLQGQADRLRRQMAKREKAPPGSPRHGPRRPGLPPGYRPKQPHDVDWLLNECDIMVRTGRVPPRW